MKEKSNKIFLFFYFYFYIIRDVISKNKELKAILKGMRYGFFIMILYTILNTLEYIVKLS